LRPLCKALHSDPEQSVGGKRHVAVVGRKADTREGPAGMSATAYRTVRGSDGWEATVRGYVGPGPSDAGIV